MKYSLRSLMIGIALLALVFALFGRELHLYRMAAHHRYGWQRCLTLIHAETPHSEQFYACQRWLVYHQGMDREYRKAMLFPLMPVPETPPDFPDPSAPAPNPPKQ